MAAPSGMEDADLGAEALLADLAAEPAAFEFFQAVRVLARLFPERAGVGRFAELADEVVHITPTPSLAFPPSEIQRLEFPPSGPAQMRVNFLGLVGPLGVLPYYYTQLVAERQRVRDTALQSFFNIFEHRILALFYRAWEKSRFTVAYERDGADRVTEHLLDLVGLGAKSARGHLPMRDEALLSYAGGLMAQPRSAVALEHLLADFLESASGSSSLSVAGTPSPRLPSARSARKRTHPTSWASALWSATKSGTSRDGCGSASVH